MDFRSPAHESTDEDAPGNGGCRHVCAGRLSDDPLLLGGRPADAQSGEPEASSPSVAPPADPSGPAVPATASASGRQHGVQIVATVNNEDIGRDELAEECLRHYGKEVLEKLTNKYLIVLECQRRGITITQEEVSAEIEKTAEDLHCRPISG